MRLDRSSTVFVTGAAGGIGTAVVTALQPRVGEVIATDRRGADIDLDVTDSAAVDAAVASVVADHGRIDAVVHASGIGVAGPIERVTSDEWRESIAVNIEGTVNVVRAAYRAMLAQGNGHIAVLGSLSGLVPTPLLTPYATTKWATVGLVLSWAPEARRHGIGFSVVCPGPVDTPLLDVDAEIDVRRYLTSAAGKAIAPEQLASAIVRAIERDRLLVVPGAAGLVWRMARLSPGLAQRALSSQMRRELARAAR